MRVLLLFVIATCLCMYQVLCVMPDSTFLSSLDYSLPALSKVEQAFKSGNITGAKEELVIYYKARNNSWFYDVQRINNSMCTAANKLAANQVVEGYITCVGVTYKFPNGSDINWFMNPTYKNPNVAFDPEWTNVLNRDLTWPTLVDSWFVYRNSSYAATLAAQITSFVSNVPVPTVCNNTDGSAWRTYESGLRGQSWPDIFNKFLSAPENTVDVMILWLKSFMDHGNYLYKFQGTDVGPNWIATQMTGLYYIGAFLPEFSSATLWRTFAIKLYYATAQQIILPDGFEDELAPGYDQAVLQGIQEIAILADIIGKSSELPPGFVEVIQVGYEFNVKIMDPQGCMPPVNDANRVNVQQTSLLGLRTFPNNSLLIWAASNRTKGLPPAYESIYFNYSRFIIMRSGWGFEDNYCCFDVAALGANPAHDHQDKLNVIINAYGRFLLYDSGGGNYEQSIYRTFSTETGSHNTVMVDNKNQNRVVTTSDPMGWGNPKTPAAQFMTTTTHDYGVGYYMDNYGDSYIATHKREVLFIKETLPCFVIVDTLTPGDTEAHNYKVLWNLLTTKYSYNDPIAETITADEGVPNLAVLPLIKTGLTVTNYIKYQNGDILWGWNINHDPPFYNPALESVHEMTKAGEVQFATLIVPIKANETSPVRTVTENSSSSFTINFATTTLLIELTEEGISYSFHNATTISINQNKKINIV